MSVSILKTYLQDNLWILEGEKVQSVLEPVGPPSWSLSWFPYHEATRGTTNPPWMGSYSITRLPNSISSNFPDNLLASIYTPGQREALWE